MQDNKSCIRYFFAYLDNDAQNYHSSQSVLPGDLALAQISNSFVLHFLAEQYFLCRR